MEGERFDLLSRLLAGQDDRRSIVRRITAAVAGLSVAGALNVDAVAAKTSACRRGRQTCTRHGQCCSGTCQLGNGFSVRERNRCACDGGTTLCGTSCVDTDSDRKHCGACGRRCPIGVPCVDGDCCVPTGGEGCRTSADCCNPAQTCNDGICECPSLEGICSDWDECRQDYIGCGDDLECCWGEGCFDTSTDPYHCRNCWTDCSYGGTTICPTCTGSGCANVCTGTFNALIDMDCQRVTGWSTASSVAYGGNTPVTCTSDDDCTDCDDFTTGCGCLQYSCNLSGQQRVASSQFTGATPTNGVCMVNACTLQAGIPMCALAYTGAWSSDSNRLMQCTYDTGPAVTCDDDTDCAGLCDGNSDVNAFCGCMVGVNDGTGWSGFATPTCVKYNVSNFSTCSAAT